MTDMISTFRPDRRADGRFALHFTPAEWRGVLEDKSFLDDTDNRYSAPRQLMGIPVEIVPDHRFG